MLGWLSFCLFFLKSNIDFVHFLIQSLKIYCDVETYREIFKIYFFKNILLQNCKFLTFFFYSIQDSHPKVWNPAKKISLFFREFCFLKILNPATNWRILLILSHDRLNWLKWQIIWQILQYFPAINWQTLQEGGVSHDRLTKFEISFLQLIDNFHDFF